MYTYAYAGLSEIITQTCHSDKRGNGLNVLFVNCGLCKTATQLIKWTQPKRLIQLALSAHGIKDQMRENPKCSHFKLDNAIEFADTR